MDLKNKRVTVMGLGLHGGAIGTIEWLVQQGANVLATDLKTETELAPSIEKLRQQLGRKFKKVQFVLGLHREEDFKSIDLVVRNPAVPRNSKYLLLAREAGVPVQMDSSLFFQACAEIGANAIIGVTGSKGKTTCTKVITALLRAGLPAGGGEAAVVEVGTDGVSPLAALADITPKTTIVFELSSWRLEALAERAISPPTAVVTSLYRDHLNTYASFEEYAETKQAIFKHQASDGRVLLNWDDQKLREWGSKAPGKVLWFSLSELKDGDGIFVRGRGDDDEAAQQAEIVIRLSGEETMLFSLDTIALPHEHGRRNALPGILLAYLAGISADQLAQAAADLTPLAHRLEIVRETGGVTYINDSAATMPDATIAALKSLAGRPIVHILGGGDKALEFTELAEAERRAKIRALIFLPGTATPAIKESVTRAFGDKLPTVFDAADMPSAVHKAREAALSGDVVLLSPAATSFGLFLHEFDRGEQFRSAVDQLQPSPPPSPYPGRGETSSSAVE